MGHDRDGFTLFERNMDIISTYERYQRIKGDGRP